MGTVELPRPLGKTEQKEIGNNSSHQLESWVRHLEGLSGKAA